MNTRKLEIMNIIVVGCGRVGGHLANLLSEDGHNISVVDKHSSAFRTLGRDFNGITIKGVGFDEDVLIEAGIEDCDVCCAVTSNDDANLMIAEVARRIFNVKHVVTRLYAPKREKVYTQLGIDFACGTTLVAEDIFAKVLSGNGRHLDTFGDYEIIRFAFNMPEEEGNSITAGELERNYGARVIVYEHDDESFMPKPSSVLHNGDIILVCIDRLDLEEFSQWVGGERD